MLLTPHIVSGKELTTGNERSFGSIPGKQYRNYRAMTLEREVFSGDVPPSVVPKKERRGYTDKDLDTERFLIKEKMYESGNGAGE